MFLCSVFLCAGRVALNWSQTCFLHTYFLGGAEDDVGLSQLEREEKIGGMRNWGDAELGAALLGRLSPKA